MHTFLEVKLLHEDATVPTVAHPGEDLAYDLYLAYPTTLCANETVIAEIGIAARAFEITAAEYKRPLGMILKDRSSLASKGLFVHGGVIDPGYTGEIKVILFNSTAHDVTLREGTKISQMVPVRSYTGDIVEVEGWGETTPVGTKVLDQQRVN